MRVLLAVVVIVALAIFSKRSGVFPTKFEWVVSDTLVVLAGLLGVYTVRQCVSADTGYLDTYVGVARSRSLGTVTAFGIDIVIVLICVNTVGLNLSGLLVGGALTGVVIGIAGQAALSNVIAGLVILFARPINIGMYVTVRAGVFGGVEYSGQVSDITLFHTMLKGIEREVRVPNSAMIGAVVVVRPANIEVNMPVVFPREDDVEAKIIELRDAIADKVKTAGVPQVFLEGATDVGFQVRLRLSVNDEEQRRVIEGIVSRVAHKVAEIVTDDEAKQAVE